MLVMQLLSKDLYGVYVHFNLHTAFPINTVSCGPPFPPFNGLIFPYTNTTEGATVTFTCQDTFNPIEDNYTLAVCNKQGKWQPNPKSFCASGK